MRVKSQVHLALSDLSFCSKMSSPRCASCSRYVFSSPFSVSVVIDSAELVSMSYKLHVSIIYRRQVNAYNSGPAQSVFD